MKKNIRQIVLLLSFWFAGFSFAEEEQTWKINLKEAEIRAFITQVSDITDRSFVIDPRVKGKVTVISQTSLNRDEVYELFLTVLHIHNFAAVSTRDGVIKIVPSNTATKDTIRIDKKGEITGEEIITRVIPVKNSPASELIPVLRPMVAQHGHLAAVPSANSIIISDHGANIEKISYIINQIDSAESEEIEVIQLEEAWVTDIVTLLENLTPVETGKASSSKKSSGGGSSVRVRVVADERTNRLILKGEKSARTRVRNLVDQLDTVAESTSGSTNVVYLRFADAKKVAELLTSLVSKNSSNTSSGRGSKSGKKADDLSRIPTFIQADETLNALVIKADPASMEEIGEIIRQLDVRRAQVLIEAAVIEVSGDAGRAIGLQWGFGGEGANAPVGGVSFDNLGNSLNDLAGAAVAANDSSGLSALTSAPALAPGLSLVGGKLDSSGDFEFGAFLQAVASSSNTNILSTPSIVTLDNEEAEIIVGQEVPITTGSSTNSNSGLSNPFTTTERKDVGLTLKVIPHIHEGDVIRLEIDQQSSALSTSASDVEAGANTITTKRSIKTTILAEDKEFIVLGGLVQESERERESKVPFFGDIPFVGALFRSTNISHDKTNLMVFLKPTIIRDSEGVNTLSRGKYAGIKELMLEIDKSSGSISVRRQNGLPEKLEDVWDTPNADPKSKKEINLETELDGAEESTPPSVTESHKEVEESPEEAGHSESGSEKRKSWFKWPW